MDEDLIGVSHQEGQQQEGRCVAVLEDRIDDNIVHDDTKVGVSSAREGKGDVEDPMDVETDEDDKVVT